MKKNNRKKPRNAINTTWRIGKRNALFTALFLPGLAFAQTVNISPVISADSGVGYSEDQANLWFLLDDSGSMGGRYDDAGEDDEKYLRIGYIEYDPDITYVLPNRMDGTPMPLPTSDWIYMKPFINDADGKNLSDWSTTTVFKYNTNTFYSPLYSDVPSCSTLEPNPTKLDNCYIWRNYYSSRIGLLKSALSLNLFGEANASKTKDVRIGYKSLHNHSELGLAPNILPVLPFYGSDADANKAKFQKWLYSLYAGNGTPLRQLYSKTVSDIITQSKESNTDYNSTKNPFADIPGQPINDSNEAKVCRRNYIVLFTDGDWNSTSESVVTANLASPSYIKTAGVNDSDTFPDSEHYSPFAPFAYKDINNTEGTPLTDIAFAAWKTDMDDETSTDGLDPEHIYKAYGWPTPTVQQHTGPSGSSSPYWHPYNDPASWQHINTYTIGFGLENPRALHINPPTTADPTGIDLSYEWQLDYDSSSISDSIEDLAGAAVAGRGRFYDTQTAEDLNNAFDDILATASGGVTTPTVAGSAGTGGASQKLDNSYYTSRYEGNSWTGELIKYNLYNGDSGMTCTPPTTVVGAVCNTAWNAGEKLTAAGPSSRKIITLKRQKSGSDLTAMNDPGLTVSNINYKMVDFTTGNISPAQQTRLESAFPSELTAVTPEADRLPALFDYIRGDNANEKGVTGGTETFRSRNEHTYLNNDSDDNGEITGDSDDVVARDILGAIVRSSPVFVGIPTGYVKHFEGAAGTAYTSYLNYLDSFMTANSSGNKEVIYVGANDGMLHAFKANTGEELFAYIPSAVYDKLPETVVPEKQLSLVDGNMDVQSVYFGTDWYRVIAGSMGGGAKGLYALNITNPDINNIKGSSVLNWEYGELESKLYQKDQGIASPKSNIGNILAKPAIIQLQDNTWVAIVGNGYNSASNKAAVIVINLQTGKPIQELVLDTAGAYSDSSKPNGLGPLYFVSYPGKPQNKSNQYDRAYAGDLQGNLWVFDLEGSDASTGIKVISQSGDTSGTPLFTAKNSVGKRQPITAYPLVVKHPLNYGYLVHFGTGALFSPDDLSSEVKNSIYAIWDDWVDSSKGGLPTARTSTVQTSELNEVKLKEETVTVKDDSDNPMDVLVRKLDNSSNTATDWKLSTGTHRGWRIDLNNGTKPNENERAWQPAYTAYGANNLKAIAYNTVTYKDVDTATECETPGNIAVSWSLAFNASDATVRLAKSGVFDINQDNSVTEADRIVKDPTGDYKLDELITGFTPLIPDGGGNGILTNPSTQQLNDCTGPGCTPPPPTSTRTACRNVTSTGMLSSGTPITSTVERCSHFSSWTELK